MQGLIPHIFWPLILWSLLFWTTYLYRLLVIASVQRNTGEQIPRSPFGNRPDRIIRMDRRLTLLNLVAFALAGGYSLVAWSFLPY